MQVLVFVTDDGSDTGTGPTLFLLDRPDAALPPHPRSLQWRYFATVGDQDEIVPIGGREGLELDGYYIARRMI